MIRGTDPHDADIARTLLCELLHQQPSGDYLLAGCAKDGSEGPPPKTPPPPPPGGEFRDLIEGVFRELTQGQMVMRVKSGAGFLGLERSPIEFVQPATLRADPAPPKRPFMVTFQDRCPVDEEALPDLILEHAKHLRRISDDGQLEAAAVFASGTHGMQILLTETKTEAERLASADPLVVQGYYAGFDIQELVPSFIGDC